VDRHFVELGMYFVGLAHAIVHGLEVGCMFGHGGQKKWGFDGR